MFGLTVSRASSADSWRQLCYPPVKIQLRYESPFPCGKGASVTHSLFAVLLTGLIGRGGWENCVTMSFMTHRPFEKLLSLVFLLIAGVTGAISPSFAQSQGPPTGQQTQQAPPSTTNLTPSGIRVDVGGALNGAIYTNKFPNFTNKFPDFTNKFSSFTHAPSKGWRAQDVGSRQRSAESGDETPTQSTDKQS